LTAPAAEPVEAATVILLRSAATPGGFECFMVRRPARSDFAADVFVFPGGRVEDADRASMGAPGGPAAATVLRGLVQPWSLYLEFRIAAIREAFEEAGVLLASDQSGEMVRFDTPDRRDRFARYRRTVHDGTHTIFFVVQREHLRLAVDRLHLLSRWITPATMPRRFDTYFFVAEMPEGQAPLHDSVETVDSTWVSPRTALDRFQAGDFPLVFATEKHLDRLAQFDSVAAVFESATSADLTPIQPRPINRDGGTAFLIPGDPGYDETPA